VIESTCCWVEQQNPALDQLKLQLPPCPCGAHASTCPTCSTEVVASSCCDTSRCFMLQPRPGRNPRRFFRAASGVWGTGRPVSAQEDGRSRCARESGGVYRSANARRVRVEDPPSTGRLGDSRWRSGSKTEGGPALLAVPLRERASTRRTTVLGTATLRAGLLTKLKLKVAWTSNSRALVKTRVLERTHESALPSTTEEPGSM
jgi:hypothetical protein